MADCVLASLVIALMASSAWAKEDSETFDLGDGVELGMVEIPAGRFWMGSTNPTETPRHIVALAPFRIGKYEITLAQYRRFLVETEDESGIDFGSFNCPFLQEKGYPLSENKFAENPNQPAILVSWYGASTFCQWLSGKTRRRFVLPTEAQWERASLGGAATRRRYGDSDTPLKEYAWISWSGGRTHPVGQKKPNQFGVHDTLGNVSEWCSDWYDADYYVRSPRKNPLGPPMGTRRVYRGGSWLDLPHYCRPAYRGKSAPAASYHWVGFRVCLED